MFHDFKSIPLDIEWVSDFDIYWDDASIKFRINIFVLCFFLISNAKH